MSARTTAGALAAVLAIVASAMILGSTTITPHGREASADQPSVIAATATPAHVHAAPPDAAPTVSADLPRGLSGRLTYRSGDEEVTVQFPEATEVARIVPAGQAPDDPSADGEWLARMECEADAFCTVVLRPASGAGTERRIRGVHSYEWSPSGHLLATTGIGPDGNAVRLAVTDAALDTHVRHIYEPADSYISAFAWTADALLVASGEIDGASASIDLAQTDGAHRRLASVPAPVAQFYPSPDGQLFAFTQLSTSQPSLLVLDPARGQLHDLGAMGVGAAPGIAPGTKAGMAIVWSPDGERIAFGGGSEPPYTLTIVELASAQAVHVEFASGYPGEIKWNAGGSLLAVSTYDAARTHHETWVVDPSTGAATFLQTGCVIVWSPDGRFLAVHGETEPGIGIVDVASGARGQLTHARDDTPLRWER